MSQNFADGLLEAERFQVVLAGQAAAANDSAAARELADKLDASPDQIAAMLKMPNYVAAHDLTRENAERYAEIFAAVGVEVRVEPETVRLAINFPPSSSPVPKDVEHNEIRRLADYQRVSGVLWIVLGIVQILSVYGIIAGVWNIPAGINAASGREETARCGSLYLSKLTYVATETSSEHLPEFSPAVSHTLFAR